MHEARNSAGEFRTVGDGNDRVREIEYRLLGPVEARSGGVVLSLGRRPRALLALLLINANQVVSTDRLIDELWGDDPGRDPQNSLWVGVSRLRSVLDPDREKRSDGSILITQLPGYRLDVDPDDIDAVRFTGLAARGRRLLDSDPERAADVLREALGLWRGHALEEFTYEPFAAAEISRLEELRQGAVEDRIDADLALGRHGELIGELEGRVHENPLRQRLVGQLMVALHVSGRQGEALRTYLDVKDRLIEEQGLDPSPELVKLEEQILLDDPALRPQASPTPVPGGLSIRGYELREEIGSGAMGNVYRAFQPAVGREVAIKVIRPEIANDPDFIRRFEVEAQSIAQLEHAQIVPVFDYWREPDSAYLVMRHFEGGSLMAAVEDEPLSIERAMTIITQLGSALSAAHRRKATHGDLKPENVLLDSEGNAFLSDFGLSSSPDAAGVEPTHESDTRRFAALTEFVLDHTVDESDETGLLQGDVALVVERGHVGDGYADVQSFLLALKEALGNRPEIEAPSPESAANPYQGLRAFGEDDAGNFFGRERLVERLLARLGNAGPTGQFVALVGPSGSGKSSVVRAGVVPALRAGAVIGSDRWFVVTMTPGDRPFESLADALRSIAVSPPPNLAERLEAEGISLVVERVSPDPSSQLVIVVDQFEELFTQTEDPEPFIDALVAAASDRHSGVKVIATMRADFYDRPLQHHELGELLRLGTEAITPMTAEELERAITQPAHGAGVTFESGAVASIAADMAGQSSALPLMQHALTELFDERTGNTITAESYQTLGGVSGALARRADALYDDLDARGQRAARDLFLRLVTVQEGSADTRRRARRTELADVAGPQSSLLLDSFGKHRLLSFDQDPVTRAPTAEIAHEALLTSWGRLRRWIDEARAAVHAQGRLSLAVAEWGEQDENPELRLTGSRLRSYEGWLEDPPVRLTQRERTFLTASEDATQAELVVERNRVRRLRRLVTVAAGAFVIAAIAAGLAVWQQGKAADAAEVAEAQTVVAQEQTVLAESAAQVAEAQTVVAQEQTVLAESAAQVADVERMRAQAAAEVGTNPPLAALLAVEAYNVDASPLSSGAIQQVLTTVEGRQATLVDGVTDYGGGAVLSADSNVIAASSSTQIDVWDIDKRELLHRIDGDFPRFDMADDASRLVSTSNLAGSFRIIDLDTGEDVGFVPGSACRSFDLSPSGDALAFASADSCEASSEQSLEIWDLSDPANPVRDTAAPSGNLWGVRWSPNGDAYVTFERAGLVQYWDAETHEELWATQIELVVGSSGLVGESVGMLFRSDGTSVVIGVLSSNGPTGIRLFTFNTETGEVVGEPLSTAGLGSMNWWDEDETQLVGTFWPSGTAIFDMTQGQEILPPPIENVNATAVFADHEQGRLVVSSFVGIEVSSLDSRSVLERRVSLTTEQLAAKAITDGQLFATMTADGSRALVSVLDFSAQAPVVEWDLTTDPPTKIDEHGPGFVANGGDASLWFSFQPDDIYVTVIDGDFEPLGPRISIEQDRGPVVTWRSSPNGDRHAAFRDGSAIYDLYDVATGERILEISPPDELGDGTFSRGTFSFSNDGSRFVGNYFGGTFGNQWVIFDTETGEIVHRGGDAASNPAWLAGTTLYSSPPGSFVLERRDMETLEEVGPPLVGHLLILNSLRDLPDSDVIVSQATNGNVRVWDRETGDQIGREISIGRQASGTDLSVTANGEVVGVLLDTEFAMWNYDLESWPQLACDIAGRNMTKQEWDDFGPANVPYRVTCPQFPANDG